MKMGLIGVGNMGSAIMIGALKSGFLAPDEVMIFDVDCALANRLHQEHGVVCAKTPEQLANECGYVLLAVKPIWISQVVQQIRSALQPSSTVISIAAGCTCRQLERLMERSDVSVVRVMPNTPAMVGAGYTMICEDSPAVPEAKAWTERLFETIGKVKQLPEKQIDAFIAVSGSSPAYVFMFIEAMADAAVKLGLSRADAIEAAAQAVLGSAKMVLDTQKHPAMLKDQVCSPGGTTIEAVQVLEEEGMRAAVMKAMVACAEKNKKMSQE